MAYNKKGDVPAAILVLGTFAVCVLALASFYISGNFFKKNFSGLDFSEQMNSAIGEYEFYSAKGLDSGEISEILLLRENFYIGKTESGGYFEINKSETNFRFGGLSFGKEDWTEKKLTASVRYYAGTENEE